MMTITVNVMHIADRPPQHVDLFAWIQQQQMRKSRFSWRRWREWKKRLGARYAVLGWRFAGVLLKKCILYTWGTRTTDWKSLLELILAAGACKEKLRWGQSGCGGIDNDSMFWIHIESSRAKKSVFLTDVLP